MAPVGALGSPFLQIQSLGPDGQSRSNGGGSLGGHPGVLEVGFNQCVHGRIEQRLQRHQAKSSRLSFCHILNHNALFRRRQTSPPPVLTSYSTENSEEPFV